MNTLYGEEGQIRQDTWDRTEHRMWALPTRSGPPSLRCLPTGKEPAEAAREAQEYVFQATRAAFRPGMGAYLSDRFFWARSNDDDETPPVVVDTPSVAPGEAHHYH